MTPDPQLTWGGIPITDWIQAAGALVAIVASIWALIKLFMRDTQREAQINSLINLAQESQRQTQQLIAHSAYMEEANQLTREQMAILRENQGLRKADLEQREKEKEIERKVRKNEIKPYFVYENGNGSNERLKLILMNKGGQAKILEVDLIEGANSLTPAKGSPEQIIQRNESYNLIFNSIGRETNANRVQFSFNLIFENVDKEKYSQRFNCNGISCKPEQPAELD